MKWLVFILFSLFFEATYAQNDDLTWNQNQANRGRIMQFLFDNQAKKPNWEDFKDEMNFEQKKQILLSLGRQDYYNKILEGNYKYEYASHYYFIDINKDGQKDIIYNSSDGADNTIFILWIKQNGQFQRILNEPGFILCVDWEKSIFLVDQPPFPEGKLGHLIEYQVKGMEVVTKSYQYQVGTYFPSSYSKIAEFETITNNYNLRTSPEIKNQPCEEYPDNSEICGNLYLKLSKGTEGKAIGKSTDNTGRVWWLSTFNLKEKIPWDGLAIVT